jgi:RNA polymerase sigma-70 factor (ECF subfamily)
LSATQAASDDVLIARIAQGDRLAMQVLYGRHHVRVFRFGLRLVRNEQAAEDLISEVFLDVWRQAGKFEGRFAVSTWLLAITRFKALSAMRRRKGFPENTVKTRLFYARKKLADLLKAAGVERGWP